MFVVPPMELPSPKLALLHTHQAIKKVTARHENLINWDDADLANNDRLFCESHIVTLDVLHPHLALILQQQASGVHAQFPRMERHSWFNSSCKTSLYRPDDDRAGPVLSHM